MDQFLKKLEDPDGKSLIQAFSCRTRGPDCECIGSMLQTRATQTRAISADQSQTQMDQTLRRKVLDGIEQNGFNATLHRNSTDTEYLPHGEHYDIRVDVQKMFRIEKILFFAIDNDKNGVLSHGECVKFITHPHADNCIMDVVPKFRGMTPDQMCTEFEFTHEDSITMDQFLKKLEDPDGKSLIQAFSCRTRGPDCECIGSMLQTRATQTRAISADQSATQMDQTLRRKVLDGIEQNGFNATLHRNSTD